MDTENPSQPNTEKQTVLVINHTNESHGNAHDDDAKNSANALFKDIDCRTVYASLDDQAIAIAQSEPITLALLDLDCSDENLDSVRKLLQSSPNIPIIFTTPTPTAGEKIKDLLDSKVVDVLAKPVDSQLLHNKVKVLLEMAKEKTMLEQQNDELTRANQAYNSFARAVGHDLRGPLGLIRSNLKYLGKENLPAERFARALDVAKRQTNHLIDMFDDLLAYAQAGSYVDISETIDLQTLIKSIDEQITETNPNYDLTVDTLPNVTGNKTGIYQIFYNLILNAIKYGKPDLPITIHISVQQHDESSTTVAVKDNGQGFDIDKLPQLLEPMSRQRPANCKIPGNGMGLAIVKQVVDSHNGILWAESEKGQGSTFYVKLPITTA